ncbi:MAG: GNAT family N-acetyltransferase [Gemmatimonadales bacterium]
MTSTLLIAQDGVEAVLFTEVDAERAACQSAILAHGGSLPVYHRVEAERLDGATTWFVGLRSVGSPFTAGYAINVRTPRFAFGHRVLRASHFGAWIPETYRPAAIGAIARLAKQGGLTLRTNVGVFGAESADVASLVATCTAAGFAPAPEPWGYQDTVMIDLDRTEEDLLASFSRSARRNIREITKYGIQVETITDPVTIPRIEAMLIETMSRTGGSYVPQDWLRRLELARSHPSLARLVGAYLGERRDPDSLAAFALAYRHGSTAEYSDAASIRVPGSRAPLAYALTWDLVRWARDGGARQFDLGGVTFGNHADSADPLGGISDFKRSFSEDVRHVGTELIFHAPSLRSGVAQWLLSHRNRAKTPVSAGKT